jgi:ribulose kinase
MTDQPDALVIGVDFGTLSGRAVVVRVRDGAELGSAVHAYPHGVVDRHAAVAAGAYPDIRAAAAAMGRRVRDAWRPDAADADRYDALYGEYVTLVDQFGRHGNDLMRRLRRIRREALR